MRLKSVKEMEATDQHIVNAVDFLFTYAFDQRASDIHLEPRRERARIRFRIDGLLHTIHQVPNVIHPAMVSRIKMLSRLDIAERRRPQDGRIKVAHKGRDFEIRVSTLPTAFGEKVVMRIFDPEILLQDISQLGFAPEQLQVYQRLADRAARDHPGHRPHRQRQDDHALLDPRGARDRGAQRDHRSRTRSR